MADIAPPRLQALVSHRVLLYTVTSTVAVSATIANALHNHSNFYSVTVYLSKSGGSVLVLANFGFLISLVCGRLMQHIFFGALRSVEVERLYDRMWFFVTESLLAFTIFRDEFDIPFAVMFGFLLFVKSFHWLMADRIEWMNQMPYPGPPTLFHIRVNGLFLILWMTNVVMFSVAVESVLNSGVGAIVLFASEYAILMASASNSMAKYFLSAYEFRRAASRGGDNAPPWENKSMWVFYVDLATDFLKLITYLVFFAVVITFYGVPLNVIRDVYVTARSFITRLRDLMRYRTATRNMDERYPNATQEEMSAMSDRTCIICREEMVLSDPAQPAEGSAQNAAPTTEEGPNTTPKKLPCGHIFHFHCLRSWLERQQSCPTCRRNVLDTPNNPPTAARAPGQPEPPVGAAPAAGPPPAVNPFGAPAGAQQQQPARQLLNYIGGLFGQPPQAQPPPVALPALAPPFLQANGQHLNWAALYPQAGQQHLQQVLPPPPPFQGFYGPGGVWQPWVLDPGLGEGAQQAPLVEPPHQTTPAAPPAAPSLPDAPPPAPPASETRTALADATPSPDPPAAVDVNEGQSSTPRDAAALAALRRIGSGSSSTAQPALRRDSPLRHDPPPASESTPAASTSAAAPGAPPPSAPRADVPSLIPLYNLSLGGAQRPTPPHPAGSVDFFRPQRPQSPPISPPPPWPTTPASTQSRGTPVAYRAAWPYPRAAAQSRSPARPPLAALPPSLSEEQLMRLDAVTRDAIDERLRVLEGVSNTLARCVEELTRMRSVLPPPLTPPAPSDPTAAPQAQPGPSSTAQAPTPRPRVPEGAPDGPARADGDTINADVEEAFARGAGDEHGVADSGGPAGRGRGDPAPVN